MPVDATSVFLLLLVLVFAVWAVSSMARARRSDANHRDLLRAFAAEHGLRERAAEGPPPQKEITLQAVGRWWSRNPATAHPPRGSAVFEGTLHGLPFVVDEVWIRRWWTDSRVPHLRMAVELPEIPPRREDALLTPERVRALEEHVGAAGSVHLGDGRLVVTRRWAAIRPGELSRLGDEAALVARTLVARIER